MRKWCTHFSVREELTYPIKILKQIMVELHSSKINKDILMEDFVIKKADEFSFTFTLI